MRRRDDNVIPFRRQPRKWTRPEDYGVPGGRAPDPRPPADRAHRRRALAVWALIFLVVALTVAWSAWDIWG